MNPFIAGLHVRLNNVDYEVRSVAEVFGKSDLPDVPRLNTVARLIALDDGSELIIEILNSDNIKILEAAQ